MPPASHGAPLSQPRAPFDLVFANILLGRLLRLAAPMARLIAPERRGSVLSGLLAAQAMRRSQPIAPRGSWLERRILLDGWATLVLRRR